MTLGPVLHVRRTAEAGGLVELRQLAADYALAAGASADDVKIAVNEALSNVLHHAFRDGATGCFELEIRVVGPHLVVFVRDDGGGPRPNPNTPGAGLGLMLIAGLSEDHKLTARPQGGAELRMTFLLPSERERV